MTYHVTSHAVADTVIVRDDGDRERFLVLLQTVAGNHSANHARRGHRFGARYYGGKVLTPSGHLLMAVRYIARNARDKGADPARYRWSSYPGVIGTRPCRPFIAKAKVLELFGAAEAATHLLRDFVEEGGPAAEADGAGGVRPQRLRPPRARRLRRSGRGRSCRARR